MTIDVGNESRCIENASSENRWYAIRASMEFYENKEKRKKGGKKERKGGRKKNLYERYRRRSAIKELDEGWESDWARKIDFFRARRKRGEGGNGSISSVLIHRGGKSGVPRDQSVGRNGLAATRNAVGTRRSHFSRLYNHCRRLWLCQ